MMHSPRRFVRAFSLIELLVVIAIIALIVSIVVPAIGSARKSARTADTQTLCATLSQACSQFILDNRRVPGYFSAQQMGSPDNTSRGFSNMQNVMLDLAGGVAPASATGANILQNVGPGATGGIKVDVGKMGTGDTATKAYFPVKQKYFRVQGPTDVDGRYSASGALDVNAGTRYPTSANDNWAIPEVVDAEGTPILMWTIDETARTPMKLDSSTTELQKFARETHDVNGTPARFYLASNCAFTRHDSVGKRHRNQATDSLLGGDTGNYRLFALEALTGSPTSPVQFSQSDADGANLNAIRPAAPRGQFIIHSAGSDGIYMSRKDALKAGATDANLYYGYSFRAPAGDIMKNFDDVVLSGG